MIKWISASEAMKILGCTRAYLYILRTGNRKKLKDDSYRVYEPKLVEGKDWKYHKAIIIYNEYSVQALC